MGKRVSDLKFLKFSALFKNKQGTQGVYKYLTLTEMSLWLFKAILLACIC